MLTDNGFKPFARMSMASPSEAALRAQPVGRISLRPLRFPRELLTASPVSLVSLRCHPRGVGQHGDQCYGTGRNTRSTVGRISHQDSSP